MALGWLTVLKMVPWDDVIKNAPKVADGAKKLWGAVAKKQPATETVQVETSQPVSADPSLAQLQQQLDTAVSEIANLQQQMLESSALIQALAEQNTQLIKRVETTRIRVLVLGAIVVVLLLSIIVMAIGAA